jgi:hypothetical protein
MNLLQPRSVVDVGCGTGAWLSEFRNQGVPQILGLDGEYVNREELLIPAASFRSVDLTFQLPDLGRRFDLAVSLEVAEHLPSSHAEEFVSDICSLSPFVLFSAAVPWQGGTGHVNEQWQPYWRRLFAGRGYIALDPVRPAVWKDRRVEWWYRRNIFLYVTNNRIGEFPELYSKRNAKTVEDMARRIYMTARGFWPH